MSTPNSASANGDGGNGSGDSGASQPKAPYHIPEFSAATQMILQRLRASGGPLAPNSQLSMGNPLALGATLPPGYEDVKRSVMEGYKTTMSGDTTPVVATKKLKAPVVKSTASKSSTPGPALGTPASSVKGKGNARGRGRPAGKRKRPKNEDESEEESEVYKLDVDSESEEEVTILPSQTLSGRKVVKPTTFVPPPPTTAPPRKRASTAYNKKAGRNVEQALCKRCSRGNSPSTNQIVFCDSCNNGWHQNCHDPKITDDLVKDQAAQWFCKTCTDKKAARAAKRDKTKQGTPAKASAFAKASTTTQPPKAVASPPVPPPSSAPLAPAPPPVVTSQPSPLSVPSALPVGGWGSMTNGEKRQYLMHVPYEHLVSAFIHATNLYPSLPVMPQSSQAVRPFVNSVPMFAPHQQHQLMNNMGRGRPYSQQPFPLSPITTANLFPRSTANPNATMNFIRKIPEAQNHSEPYTTSLSFPNNPYHSPHHFNHSNTAHLSPAENLIFENAMDVDMNLGREEQSSHDPFGAEHGRLSQHSMNGTQSHSAPVHNTAQDNHVDEESSDESRDSTPASPPYPKAGTGAMSKLKTDDEELEWLIGGDEDEVAFSHTILEVT